ncbi:hypothetical protein M9C83_07625 [SAR86 cluster bacterium]|nr:hypothetical protein M9C83_07625 [SAR86 cluster bacterium]
MQEDEELTLEDVEDKIEKLESDINDRLDAQEEVLESFNEALERIDDYLTNTLGNELEIIEVEIEHAKERRLEVSQELREEIREEVMSLREYINENFKHN